MGLLDLLSRGKTSLDIEVPSSNGGPINVPANNFVQNYLPDKSYLDSTQGRPNNGSELATTLSDTSLDNTDIASTTSTVSPSPDLTTQYTQYNTGKFGEAAETFIPRWSQDKPYISNYSPTAQTQTVNETGLDVEASNAVPTAANPNNETSYPELSRGEFGGSSNQFRQTYTPNNTYLNNINPNTQPQTLNETGLDVENPNAAPTTQLPDNYTPYPQYVQGEFNGATSQYVQTYTPSNPYMGNIVSISGNETNTQVNSLFSTGLDTEAEEAAPTTPIPVVSTEYPSLVTSRWGQNANQFYQRWSQEFTYLNIVGGGSQYYTLNKTGLDVENLNSAPTTFTPNNISAPTDYSNIPPQARMGEFGISPSQYTQNFNPSQTYGDFISTITNLNFNPQFNTLFITGLDIEDPNFVSATVPPNSISAPTDYSNTPPQAQMGEFGGAASQYTTPYGPNNTYLDNFSSNTQVNTLDETGLDVENSNAAPTTFVNSTLTDPTTYPSLVTGRWNGNPNIYYPSYTPSFTYWDITTIGRQYFTLDNTGLDVEDPDHNNTAPTPNSITDPTVYPDLTTGQYGFGPSIYNQIYNPNYKYWNNFYLGEIQLDQNIDPQVQTLSTTGLDVENNGEGSSVVNPNNISTEYGLSTYTARGRYNSIADQYVQQWYPNNYYYDLSNSSNWDKLGVEILNPSLISLDDGGSGLDIENTDYNYLTFDVLGAEAPYPYINSSHVYWGKFYGPPEQFSHPYRPNFNQYYGDSNYNELISLETNPQINSLSTSSLQIDPNDPFNLFSAATFIPTDPTVYPVINEVNLGEFNGAPSLYGQSGYIYTSIKYYLDSVNLTHLRSLTQNDQIRSLNTSSLDIAPAGYAFDSVTNYPVINSTQPLIQVNLGEFGFGPSHFSQYYKPNHSYLTSLNGSIQIESLQNSGLDIEDISNDPFLSAFSPPIPDTVTEYPAQSYVHLDGVANEFYPDIDVNSNPSLQYTQRWKPTRSYYSYMKNGEFAPSAA